MTYSTLVEELEPKGFIEVMLLERIAFYYTKLQRAIHIDTKQITIQKIVCQMTHLQQVIPDSEELGELLDLDFSTNKQIKEELEDKIDDLQLQVRQLEK